MTLNELCHNAGLSCPEEFSSIEINNVVPDSRRVQKGDIFIAVKGRDADGHRFVSDAVSHGAVAVVSEEGREIQDLPEGFPVIRVKDSREASAKLFASANGNPQKKMKFVGVTGTNGKTTVSTMLCHILRCAGYKCGLIGTTGAYLSDGSKIDILPHNSLANMTTPDPEELYKILSVMADAETEYIVMEVTSHALSLSKVEPIDFEAAIFTNLTEEHLDFHGDMESYFAAKYKLLRKSRFVVTNCDDLYGRALKEMLLVPVYTCSCEGRTCDYCARELKTSSVFGVEYKIIANKLRARITCPIPGKFTAMNSLQAAACAYKLGIDARTIKNALATVEGVDGRLDRVRLEQDVGFSVFVDYAHTPDALENLLRAAHDFKKRGQRIVLLFGCGGDRDRTKRAHMGSIASSMADFIIVTSDNSRSERAEDIINEILSGMDAKSKYTVIPDRRQAIEYAVAHAQRGDIILLAGKGHETYEIDREGRKPFCEKEIVKNAVEKYYK